MPAPILIVEDDTDINNMMAEALTKAGYACTQAFSGTEGLLYLDQGPYALVILDLMLPGLEGEALLPQIKAKTGTPVLVVSAKDSLDSKVGLLTAGAEDYLFSVTCQGQPVELTRQEFRILELLLSHPGRVFSKQAIYDYAWEEMYLGEDKTINVHISNIRKKLRGVSDREYIETVWGIGFRLAP